MKLQNDFYRIEACDAEGGSGRFRLVFNASHPIYQAHFPQRPITPGVCTIQTVGELAEILAQKPLQLVCAKNVKFLSLLTPECTPQVFVDVNVKPEAGTERLLVRAELHNDGQTFAKLSLVYV